MSGTKTFGKNERLLKPKDFQRVRKAAVAGSDASGRSIKDDRHRPDSVGRPKETSISRARKYSTKSLLVYVAPTEVGKTRLGLSVSARVGPSVRRSRIKRLLREHFRLNKALLPDSVDIMITVKDAACLGRLSDVERELEFLTRKAQRN